MSDKVLRFTCTKVNAGSVSASVKPDKDGYYRDLIFGAFDIVTPQRWAFPLAGVEHLLEPGSPLHRRATSGALKGEWGHPRQMPGESDQAFMQRIAQVDEKNTAIHIRDFRLVQAVTKSGKKYYQVRGDVKASGPYGKYFTEAMANPHENIGLSIRGVSSDKWIGTTKYSTFRRIFNWDVVNEQGIPEANKMDSVLDGVVNMQQYASVDIPVSSLLKDGQATPEGITMLNNGVDLYELIRECAESTDTSRGSLTW